MTVNTTGSSLSSTLSMICSQILGYSEEIDPLKKAEKEFMDKINSVCDPIIRKFELMRLAMKTEHTKLGVKASKIYYYDPDYLIIQAIKRRIYGDGKDDILENKTLETAIDIPLTAYAPLSPHAKALAMCDDITAIALKNLADTYKAFDIKNHINTYKGKCEQNYNLHFPSESSSSSTPPPPPRTNTPPPSPSPASSSTDEIISGTEPPSTTLYPIIGAASPHPTTTSVDTTYSKEQKIEGLVHNVMLKLWEDPQEIEHINRQVRITYNHFTSKVEHEKSQFPRDMETLESMLEAKRVAFSDLLKKEIIKLLEN